MCGVKAGATGSWRAGELALQLQVVAHGSPLVDGQLWP